MRGKKLGPFLLSGLMVGPVLGSGIFILPPLVYGEAGEWALPAWMITVCLNAVFAFVFGFLSIRFPGSGGVSDAIAHAFGIRAGMLASLYLISAVIFGPAAVLLTIAQYLPLPPVFPEAAEWLAAGVFSGQGEQGQRMLLALGLVGPGYVLLLQRIRAVGTVALVLSSVSAVLLFAGGILVLALHDGGQPLLPETGSFETSVFGHALLMLFWIIVGWEVVGNYSGDVETPGRTIPRAVLGSVAAVTLVEMCVALAVQREALPTAAGYGVARLLYPLFGDAGQMVCALLVTALCTTTYLMFVGGVARLVSSLAASLTSAIHVSSAFGTRSVVRGNRKYGRGAVAVFLPLLRLLERRNGADVPVGAVTLLCVAQAATLIACMAGLARLESLVSVASGFFLANALMGIAAAIVMLHVPWQRGAAGLLATVLLVVLWQAAWFVLAVVAVLAVLCLVPWKSTQRRDMAAPLRVQGSEKRS
ncbi:APC family permease [Desulfovibrio psychrotolerans]|uniref:Amino acid permease n=1 Tax=Desulfovibrio psychrotolerans TaxID=415242 RepID=A0A7J0BPX5_9BACT|nr:APC family permease [Desulfovibrio psychrotolerans]GFM35709.1 hypothetical protein DSM19430T_03930 [Desulfovibrio psychrotolerans]